MVGSDWIFCPFWKKYLGRVPLRIHTPGRCSNAHPGEVFSCEVQSSLFRLPLVFAPPGSGRCAGRARTGPPPLRLSRVDGVNSLWLL